MRHALNFIAITLLTGFCSDAHAQQQNAELGAQPAPGTTAALTLRAGESLHVVIERGFRIKRLQQAVTGEVTEPVFIADRQVIAAGSVVHGRITSLATAGGKLRAGRLLAGDFTPPKAVTVTFDELVGIGGQSISLETEEATPLQSTKMFLHKNKQDRPKVEEQVKVRLSSVIHTPNKLQKFAEAAVTSLPFHPEFIDEGTVFNSRLLADVTIPASSLSTNSKVSAEPSDYLRLRLLTPLNSESVRAKQPIEAVVSAPFYDDQQKLIYPAGLVLSGNVTQANPARWFQKQGSLNFQFTSVTSTQGELQRIDARVSGVEAGKGQALSIDDEGAMKVTYSTLKRITAPLSLIGPSRGLADPSRDKTAFQRGGQGRKGFGLAGTGAAQASASAAVGFGYYGAARKLYGAFIAKGTDVDLPADTSLLLTMNR